MVFDLDQLSYEGCQVHLIRVKDLDESVEREDSKGHTELAIIGKT